MDWDIPMGRIIVFQEEPQLMGMPVHSWLSRYIRLHPWIGFIGAWCLLGEACVAAVAMENGIHWLAEKAIKGLACTGGAVALNLLFAGSVQKVCASLGVCVRETSQLFTSTFRATCCCITWFHEY